jgi:hypothetical protein
MEEDVSCEGHCSDNVPQQCEDATERDGKPDHGENPVFSHAAHAPVVDYWSGKSRGRRQKETYYWETSRSVKQLV